MPPGRSPRSSRRGSGRSCRWASGRGSVPGWPAAGVGGGVGSGVGGGVTVRGGGAVGSGSGVAAFAGFGVTLGAVSRSVATACCPRGVATGAAVLAGVVPIDDDPGVPGGPGKEPPGSAVGLGDGLSMAPLTPPVGRKPPPRVRASSEIATTRIAAAIDGRRPGRPREMAGRARMLRGATATSAAAKSKPHDGQSPPASSQHQRHA